MHPPKSIPPRAELVELIDNRMSRSQLAKHYSVGLTCIENWLRMYELSTNGFNGRQKMNFPVAEIRAMVQAGKSPHAIAIHFRCCYKTIIRIMRSEGIVVVRHLEQRIVIKQPIGQVVKRSTPSAEALFAANWMRT